MQLFDDEFMLYVINREVRFPVLLGRVNLENGENNRYSYTRKCFCPFHDNTVDEAAKIYKDERGDTLWCFSEQKKYFPSDVFKRKLIKIDYRKFFYRLWDKISENRKEQLLEEYGVPQNTLPEKWVNNKEVLSLFKKGNVDINMHLRIIISSLE